MATITNHFLAGAPLEYSVTVATRSAATFHRVKLAVTVKVNGTDSGTFSFSKPVIEGSPVSMDISSAVQAVVNSREAVAATGSYPVYGVSVVATEEWMTDGSVYTADLGTESVSGIYAGRYTDAERLGFKTLPAVWSRKPTDTPEVCFTGYPHIVAGQREPSISGGSWVAPAVSVVEVADGLTEEYNIYGVTKPADGHELRFINSLGVHENIFLRRVATKQVNITTEKFTISRSETFSSFSRGLTQKSNDYETWQLSSGPLNEEWTSWFLHEVCMAEQVWIEVNDSNYIPCHILPDETMPLLDRTKAGMMEVLLKIQLEINGGV